MSTVKKQPGTYKGFKTLNVSRHGCSVSCPLCSKNHDLSKCGEFKEKSCEDKMKIIQKARLCINYKVGYMAKGCMEKSEVTGHKRKHNTVLLPQRTDKQVSKQAELSSTEDSCKQGRASEKESGNCGNTSSRGTKVCLRIFPVRVRNQNIVIETYALLDDGSDISLCDEKLLEELGTETFEREFYVTTQEKKDSVKLGAEVKLSVEAIDSSEILKVPRMWTVNQLNVSTSSIPSVEDINKWPHLHGISLPGIEEKDTRLLIGGDVPEAFWILDERRGERGDRYAVKSLLGWTLIGPTARKGGGRSYNINFCHENKMFTDDLLSQQVEKFWKTDF